MVDERTAYWGERDAARYRTQDDDPTGGDYVVAETLDANGDPVDVLLRWDDTAGEWVSGGPVNMDGSDVTNVGALDADSVSADTAQANDISPKDDATVGISDVYPFKDFLFGGEGISSTFSDKKIQAIGQGTDADQTYEICTLSGSHDFVEVTFAGHNGATSSTTRDGYVKWVVFPASDGATDNYRLEKIHDYGGGAAVPTLSVDQATGVVEVTKYAELGTGWLKVEAYGTEVTA